MCLFSFDAIKRASNRHRRPQADIDAELLKVVQGDAWIWKVDRAYCLKQSTTLLVSGGWTSEWLRAWRLAIRPFPSVGRTRPELPQGNVDWPWEQYKFAIRSLRNRTKFRTSIYRNLTATEGVRVCTLEMPVIWPQRSMNGGRKSDLSGFHSHGSDLIDVAAMG